MEAARPGVQPLAAVRKRLAATAVVQHRPGGGRQDHLSRVGVVRRLPDLLDRLTGEEELPAIQTAADVDDAQVTHPDADLERQPDVVADLEGVQPALGV